MLLVPPVTIVAAQVKPYVENHLVGRVWYAVAGAVGVLEIVGVGRRRAEATKHDRGSQFVLRGCVVVALIVVVLSVDHVPATEIRPPFLSVVVGIVLFAAGEGLRLWSRRTLGRYFTYTVQTSSDQPVITTGPYRLLRHPSYTGVLLLAVGAGFVEGNWLGLAALALMTFVGLRYRIHVEEKALLADLGDRYRTFAEHRKRLIPLVW
jgi:protein-S-isoprenylcysteine O-methyltransferase Ste14